MVAKYTTLRRRLAYFIVTLSIFASAIVWILQNPPSVLQSRVLSVQSLDEAGNYTRKVNAMLEGIQQIPDTFLIGYGQDEDYYYKYKTALVHNIYILIFLENGGLGFIGFMGILIVAVIRSFKFIRVSRGQNKIIAIGLFSALFTELATMTTNTNMVHRFWWIIILLALATNNLVQVKSKPTVRHLPTKVSV